MLTLNPGEGDLEEAKRYAHLGHKTTYSSQLLRYTKCKDRQGNKMPPLPVLDNNNVGFNLKLQ